MKKKKHTAGRVLAAALSTAFAVIAVPVQAFAEQIPPTEESALVTESETTAVTAADMGFSLENSSKLFNADK